MVRVVHPVAFVAPWVVFTLGLQSLIFHKDGPFIASAIITNSASVLLEYVCAGIACRCRGHVESGPWSCRRWRVPWRVVVGFCVVGMRC